MVFPRQVLSTGVQRHTVFRPNGFRPQFFWGAVEAPAEEPAQEPERPAGGYGWSNLHQLELARRLRRKLREDESRETVRAALSVGEPAEMVRHFVQAYAPTRRVERAIDYAKRTRTETAYRRAVAEMARQIEDEELLLVLTVLGLV